MAKELLKAVPPPEAAVSKINKVGLVVLLIILTVALFLTSRAIFSTVSKPPQSVGLVTGRIISPDSGAVVSGNIATIKAEASSPDGIASVEFWAKHNGNWQKIGSTGQPPYILDWDTSGIAKPYAVTLTIHVTDKQGNTVTDPGGWREDIVLVP